MNNTEKAEGVRQILAKKSSDYEKSSIELHQNIRIREINYKMDNLAVNETNNKTLEAINFLLDSLEN